MSLGPGFDIIIYAGQSNEVGRGIGPWTDSDPSNDGAIFQVGRWGADDMTIVPMAAVLQFWSQSNTGHGHGITYARLYAAQRLEVSRQVLLVPAADGGTSILQWLGLIQGNGNDLWGDMAARIAFALGQPGNNRIVAWVEHQGETDIVIALNPSDPNHALMPDAMTYQARKLDLIDKVRSAFGTFPMTFGLFAPGWIANNPVKASFQAALAAVCAQRPLCATVDTSWLSDNHMVDPSQTAIHFSAAAQETLAVRHAAALAALLDGDQDMPVNYLAPNSAFDYWSSGSSFSIPPNLLVPVADGWTAYRPASGEMTISKQPGFLGALNCLRFQRNVGTVHTQTASLFRQIPSRIASYFAGKTICVSYAARCGAAYSPSNHNFGVNVYTAPGIDEAFDSNALVFPSPTVATLPFNAAIAPGEAVYAFTYAVPSDCKEMMLRFRDVPQGTAGDTDYAEFTNCQLTIAAAPTAYMPEPV
jgi:hypothetical protein